MSARTTYRRRPRWTVVLIPVLVAFVAFLLVRGRPSAGAGQTYAISGAFSRGACMSYAPTSGDRHLTVFLDAGHGGVDPGAVGTTSNGTTIYESHLTLAVELDAEKILRGDGFRVVVSRSSQTNVVRLNSLEESGGILTVRGAHDDVAARDICANRAHANLLIGIYFDADNSPSGAGCLTAYDRARPFWKDNLRLATLVQSDVLSAMNAHGWQIPNLGVETDGGLGSYVTDNSTYGRDALSYNHLLLIGPPEKGYFTTPSTMPGALIEPLFITDPFEGTIAASVSGQQTIARGIAKAVGQYFARS